MPLEAQEEAFGWEVTFHPDLGYPISALIDPEENTIDEEIDYFILELTPAASE